jgi:hypothetical protein
VQGVYHPFRQASLPLEERVQIAKYWLSYYFTRVPDLSRITDDDLRARVPLHEHPVSGDNTDKTPTFLRISEDELTRLADPTTLVRSSIPILVITPAVFAANFERALFNTDGILPSVGVVVAWSDESTGDTVFAAKTIWDRVASEQPADKYRRGITFYQFEGGNHVVRAILHSQLEDSKMRTYFQPQWDYPELFISMLTSHV